MDSTTESGFPPFTLVTASSEATLAGFDEPAEPVFGGACSQDIPVGVNEIQRLSFLLVGRESGRVEIPVRISRCNSPLESSAVSAGGPSLREAHLSWSGTVSRWVDWEVNLTPLSGIKVGGYIRVELELPEGVGWMQSRRCEPGLPAAHAGQSEARVPQSAPFCFRVSPRQPCFWAANVLPESAGRNRFTGMWRSDPAGGMPQWIEASWRDPLLVEELLFDFPDSPECPASYELEASAQGRQHHSLLMKQVGPRAIHRFDEGMPMDRFRITFLSTKAAPSVSVHRMQMRLRL